MKKRLILLFMFILLLTPVFVNASIVTCKYKNAITDIYIKYDYDNPVTYEFGNKINNYTGFIVKEDFINLSDIICPTISIIVKQAGRGYAGYSLKDLDIYLSTDVRGQGGTVIDGEKIFEYYDNKESIVNKGSINITNNSNNEDPDLFDTVCADFSGTLKIGGIIILIIKVLLPLLIIVKSSFDLFSVVTKGDSEELKKKVNKLVISIIGAILIFFVPTIVNTIFGIVTDIRGVASTTDMNICRACLFDPLSTTCGNSISSTNKSNSGNNQSSGRSGSGR